MSWPETIGTVIASGGLVQILNWVRNTRKDVAKVRAEEQVRSDTLTMQMWVEITKEQRDWRDTLRKQLDTQQLKIEELQQENAGLLRRLAELEGRNADLQQENDELEKRVMFLEGELRKAGEAVSG